MNKKLLLSILGLFCVIVSYAQYPYLQQQYFDGADTSKSNSIIISTDTASTNIWQIGQPQKIVFDSAATKPNVIVTDTINNYPISNTSSFSFKYKNSMNYGILALRWKQKLDMVKKHSGGIIEYSTDTGKNWVSVFNNPHTYSFYGFNVTSKDTLLTGDYTFSGTDSAWKDIWLCFDNSLLSLSDSVIFRFTFKSDTLNETKEGWMIDDMRVSTTITHTVKKMEMGEYMRIYPNATTGIVNIEAEKLQEFHIIENMLLINSAGRVVASYGVNPTKTYIDISNQPDGQYYLKIKTNIKSVTLPVVLKK